MAHFQRNAQTAWRRVDNEMLIVGTQGNKLTILNDTAARVWELLDGSVSSSDLAKVLAAEFEVDAAAAEADVERLLNDLSERKLVARLDP
jgi:hypothetical protein